MVRDIPLPEGEPVSVTINTILILTSDGNLHIWVSAFSRRVLTRLGRVSNALSLVSNAHARTPWESCLPGKGDFLCESITPEAESLRQPCLMARSPLSSLCTRSRNRSRRRVIVFSSIGSALGCFLSSSYLQIACNSFCEFARAEFSSSFHLPC